MSHANRELQIILINNDKIWLQCEILEVMWRTNSIKIPIWLLILLCHMEFE